MKICLVLLFSISAYFSEAQNLFKIIEKGKYGFIDSTGKKVIDTKFHSASDFTDGIAAVRENGLYGYINTKGKYIIKPKFITVSNYYKGMSYVRYGDSSYLINMNDEQLLTAVYDAVTILNDSLFILTTYTKKEGLYNLKTKKFIIDTIYSRINGFENNCPAAVVTEYNFDRKKEKRLGVINIKGDTIIPFGKYNKISSFSEGYAIVSKDKNKEYVSFVNAFGKEIAIESKDDITINNDFKNGFAPVSFFDSETGKFIDAYLNTAGQIVCYDTLINTTHPFSFSRAFIEKESDFYLIDTNFKILGKFYDVPKSEFINGYTIVEQDSGFGIIDTTGNYIVKPTYNKIISIDYRNKCFVYSDDDEIFGVKDFSGNTIITPVFEEKDYDTAGFKSGILQTLIDEKLTYINNKNKIIWQKTDDNAARKLNIDFKNYDYYLGSTVPFSDTITSLSKKIYPKLIKGKVTLSINATIKKSSALNYKVYNLIVANYSSDTISFTENRYNKKIIIQAKNINSEWKDIGYRYKNFSTINPMSYLKIEIPVYDGDYKTKLRVAIIYTDSNTKQEVTIYSNEITANINLGQFYLNHQGIYHTKLFNSVYKNY